MLCKKIINPLLHTRNKILLYLNSFQKLTQQLELIKLQVLDVMNIPIQCEGFNPESSQVSLSLTVIDPREWKPTIHTDRRWNSSAKTFAQVMDITGNNQKTGVSVVAIVSKF